MTRILGPRSNEIFNNSHNLYLQPNEFAANKNYDRQSPINLALPIVRRHPLIPGYPAYPEALVRDARLAAHPKDRSMLLMTDAAMHRLWLREAREHAEVKYVANWHREVREDREEFELAWVVNEIIRREHFFHAVDRILHTRERGHMRARRVQQLLFKFIREHSLRNRIKLHDHTVFRIKQGLDMHAKSLAWRLDNLYLESDTHSMVKVKHGGHHVEHVIGDILWQLRAKRTEQAHEWRIDNLYLPTDTQGYVRVKHHGRSLEAVQGGLHSHHRRSISNRHREWRLDNKYATLPNGSFTKLHHVPGEALEHVFAKVNLPKEHFRDRLTRRWHESKREVVTANRGIVHEEGLGALPENAAADLYLPVLIQRQKDILEEQGSHQVLKMPNGGFIHSNRGHVRGQSPELLTAELNKPHQEKVTKGHEDWHKSHLAAPTPNHGIAPLKGHGQSFEHVAARASDIPKHKVVEAYKQWRQSHIFVTNSNHQMVSAKIRGYSFAKVTSDVSGRSKDLITQHFLERRQANQYVKTDNGGWRRLEQSGKSLDTVYAQVAEPTEGTDGKPVIKATAGQETTSSKVVKEEEKRRTHRRDFSAIQKSLAAHEHSLSQLQGHVVHEAPPVGAVNVGTLQKIAAYAPKKTGSRS